MEELSTAEKIYAALRLRKDVFADVVCEDVVTGKVPDFHMELYGLLDYERLVVAAPRGFAKSTIIAKIYPLYCALFKLKKDICIISASEGLATEHLRYIKTQMETNPVILKYFGDLKSDKWTENHIVAKHPDGTVVTLRAKGAGGQIRGFRPDCLILDDIETDEGVESEEQRRKLKDWLFKACINCLLPGGQLIIIGTILHELSLLNDLLETPNGWQKHKYRAYVDGVEEPGHELWPEERGHEWLQQRKREIGSTRFAFEYLNDPKMSEDSPIKPDMIRFWDALPKQLSLAIALDPAYSEESSADYKVAVLVGMDEKYNRYLVDYIRTHNPTGEFIDAVLNMYIRHKGYITAFGMPNSGPEKEFYKSVENKAMERGLYPPFMELKNVFNTGTGQAVRNKKKRIIAALQPLFEQGKYYIHESHYEAREELLTIGGSRWDDVVDAMAYAEQIITPHYYDTQEPKDWKETVNTANNGSYGLEY